jgi:hypothetical protein
MDTDAIADRDSHPLTTPVDSEDTNDSENGFPRKTTSAPAAIHVKTEKVAPERGHKGKSHNHGAPRLASCVCSGLCWMDARAELSFD